MTDKDYTHITLVSDRSGSMNDIKSDAEGAINGFIQKQAGGSDKCTFTLVDFDAGREDWYRTMFNGPVANCPRYTLTPRGGTALFDATARAIEETGEYLAGMGESGRPGKVVFVVQTDGYENSSRKHTQESVAKMVREQTDAYSWQFVFLGTGPDTWEQGRAMNFDFNTRAAGTGSAFRSTYDVLSQSTMDYRSGGVQSMAGTNVEVDAEGDVAHQGGSASDEQE